MDFEQRQRFWNVLKDLHGAPEDSDRLAETLILPRYIYRYRFPDLKSISALGKNQCFFSTSNYYDDPFDTFLRIDRSVVDNKVSELLDKPEQFPLQIDQFNKFN